MRELFRFIDEITLIAVLGITAFQSLKGELGPGTAAIILVGYVAVWRLGVIIRILKGEE